ncbi:glycosyltransferase family 2 protein [Aequorivita todarodis]|uniref:glycosyltransferase family 2 protein n=1 Tax=Aequorivita todarodis TaxID=2036821 RepID=UPI00235008AA|nr:glycosyltransferase family 2 protein [Aequorivita todarodis]MDC8000164.1 glycosyltransferase family 2 protein [Aequorivita todarodis]
MPKFSVVISVFNKEKYIADTLKSVLAQTFTDFEVVILNDGSTDNSEAEILKFDDPRIRYFSKENQGAGAARNFVINEAKYDYIALLDADDFLLPFYLEEQARLIAEFPNESVFATAIKIEKKGKIYPSEYSVRNLQPNAIHIVNFFSASFLNSILTSSSTVLHKNVFSKVGYYDPSIKSGQDTDLWIRIGLKYPVVFLNKSCAIYRYAIASLSNSTLKVSQKASFENYEPFEKDNPALKKFLDLNRYSLCILAKIEGNKEAFQKNFQKIDPENLSKKQQFLLRQNKTILKYLSKTKNNLEKLGLRLGTFK